MRAVVIAVALAWSAPAVAQPGLTPPSLTQPNEATPVLTKPKKDRTNGILLSLVGTTAPVVMFVAAVDGPGGEDLALAAAVTMLVGPSWGHWYAGKFLTTGMGLRAIGGGVAVLSVMALIASEGDGDGAEKTFWLGTAMVGVGALYDLATAGSAVDDWNRKHATVMPTALKVGDGYGIGMVGRF